jgi:CRP-like cAMP-binding protein
MLTFITHLGKEVGEDAVEIAGVVRQTDIAAMASVTRESVSRVLGRWRREGILLPDLNGRMCLRRSLVAREATLDG